MLALCVRMWVWVRNIGGMGDGMAILIDDGLVPREDRKDSPK